MNHIEANSAGCLLLQNGPASHEEQIADAFGTPLFVYDGARIDRNYRELRAMFDSQADVFYSLKANPNVSVAGQLRRLGAGAEVSSLTELEVATRAGFAPADTIFVGPLKTQAELLRAIDMGICALVVDSFDELRRIHEIGQARGSRVPVLLRINPEFKIAEAPIKMSGVATQFGFSESEIFNTPHAFQFAGISLRGIHVYNGSRVLNEDAIARNVEKILELSDRIAESLNYEPAVVDVGGGWGVPYFKEENPIDPARMRDLLHPVIAAWRTRRPQCRIITESGRYLVATAGRLLARVHAVKISHGERFAVTDAGYNCFMAAAGFGSFMQRNFPVTVINPRPQGDSRSINLAGPLCTPGDLLARKATLPSFDAGALIAVEHAGAYGPSASPVGFIGHGHPAEVLVLGECAHLIRERDRPQDLLRLQHDIHAVPKAGIDSLSLNS